MSNAVIQGDFVDIKNVKTRSVVQMIIEIPIEQGEDLVMKFGYPNNHTCCPVAIAKITPKLVPETSKDEARRQSDLGQGGNKPKSFAGHGKMLAQDPDMNSFLSMEHGELYARLMYDVESTMKNLCEISSCSELIEGSIAYERFVVLRKDFNAWKRANEQAAYAR